MKTVNGAWYPGRGLAQRPSDALVEKSSKGTATRLGHPRSPNPDAVLWRRGLVAQCTVGPTQVYIYTGQDASSSLPWITSVARRQSWPLKSCVDPKLLGGGFLRGKGLSLACSWRNNSYQRVEDKLRKHTDMANINRPIARLWLRKARRRQSIETDKGLAESSQK